jgi:phospholipase D-like protein
MRGMTLIWGTIAVLVVIVWAITVYDIFRQHLGGKSTTLWILLTIFLPFIGAIIYWSVRKPRPEDIDRSLEADAALRDEARRRPIDSPKM